MSQGNYNLPEKHPLSGYFGIDTHAEGFAGLAKRCAMGDVQAMLRLSDELRGRLSQEFRELLAYRISDDDDTEYTWLHAFFKDHEEDRVAFLGANFWLTRAAIYGSEEAKARLLSVPEYRISLLSEEFQSGKAECEAVKIPGRILREIGLLDFTENKDYILEPLNRQGIYVARYFVKYDDWDKTGFGMEDYFNYYFFDEYFCLLFMLEEWSRNDIGYNEDRIVADCWVRRREKQAERDAYWEKQH